MTNQELYSRGYQVPFEDSPQLAFYAAYQPSSTLILCDLCPLEAEGSLFFNTEMVSSQRSNDDVKHSAG